jgi:murein DD-endopeptidase MepM/ murein hydrolase activator NlpD
MPRPTDPRRALLGACLAAAAALAAPRPADAQLDQPALELRVPKAPTVARGDGAAFLAYELHLTNLAPAGLTLRRVEVLDAADGRVLLALQDSALAVALARPGVPAPRPPATPEQARADRLRLGGGLRAVTFLWVPVDARGTPARLRHRVTVAPTAGDTASPQTLAGAPVAVGDDVAVIGPPLRGGGWLAANGPAPTSGHRRALIAVDGVPAIAQRFAIDWLVVDGGGRTHAGDPARNESYFAEGKEAIAVADGVVAATKDGIPENVPGITSRAVPITLETVGGNHVVLDIGRGRYAFYAHLKPGSLRVKPGDRVTRGQVVGLVGNSGNSTEPHLHFHLMDGTSPLGAEGVPYVHDDFELTGRCAMRVVGGTLAVDCPRAAETRRRELPMANMLVRYP